MTDIDTKILKALAAGPSSSKQIAATVGAELADVRKELQALVAKGAVSPPGARGKTDYSLAPPRVANGDGSPVHPAKPGVAKATNGKTATPKAAAAHAAPHAEEPLDDLNDVRNILGAKKAWHEQEASKIGAAIAALA